MDLKEYEQRKFALAEVIRSAQAIDTKDYTLLGECRDLLARLAEDRFNLMVVGRFSRGKSTLMNAILGGDHLPTGIVPLTSVITTVRYGSRKQVVLHFIDSGLSHEVPLPQLADYVTQKANPGNVKRISYAEIQLRVELLRRGLFFVDSPGLGSPIIENTHTTDHFLPQADAFILVTSYESPLSDEERRILRRIQLTNKKVYIVVNKHDTVNARDRDDALEFVSEQLKEFQFPDPPRIYSVSARHGLQAKQSQNVAQLEESGIQTLEVDLSRFLFEQRAQSFLVNMYERTLSFLERRSRSNEHSEHEGIYTALIRRLSDLRESILGQPNLSEPLTHSEIGEGSSGNVLEVDRKSGCRICGLILEAVFRFLSKYQYQLTIDAPTQHEHARRGGFCALHTWQYEGISSPYGVCTAFPQLAHRFAQILSGFAELASNPDALARDFAALLPNATTCRVCEVRLEAERQAVEEVAQTVRSADGTHVPACCLPHLRMVTRSMGGGKPVAALLRSHADLLERTAEDLQRFAMKYDALRRHLTSEEERRASQLALLLLAGHRNVNSPWVIEYIL
jgi:GTP-binding protein EngB required for normal cell division